ncbi:MAG: hypothetical protein KAR14_09645, partial [Candidatus Aminicenantes bacterium]|nr:hypothetical protein [Candidatus Aminicenantes bacterium]
MENISAQTNEDVPDMDSKEETKAKSEEIKQALEKLETENHEKSTAGVVEEKTIEKIADTDLTEKLADLT